jgi:hypothetical protein
MRYALLAAAIVGILSTSAMLSSASADTMKNCAASWKAMSKADQGKTTYKAYSATCLKSGAAPMAAPAPAAMAAPVKAPAMAAPVKASASMPAAGAIPAGATGVCNDGTYTMSKTHSGACSHHKGVSKWL